VPINYTALHAARRQYATRALNEKCVSHQEDGDAGANKARAPFKGKTFPNQGIRLSLHTAVFVGLNAVCLVTFAMALRSPGDLITLSRTR